MKAITEEKKEFLKKQGFTEEQITLATTLNKEVEPALEKQDQPVVEVKTEIIPNPVEKEKVVETEETLSAEVIKSLPEVIETVRALPDIFKGVMAQIKSLSDIVTAQTETIAQLRTSDETKIAKQLEGTPAASRVSLKELIEKQIQSSDSAKVDGRTVLAKDAPQQAPTGPVDLWHSISIEGNGDWRATLPTTADKGGI